jgi:hypothetical protein
MPLESIDIFSSHSKPNTYCLLPGRMYTAIIPKIDPAITIPGRFSFLYKTNIDKDNKIAYSQYYNIGTSVTAYE